MRAKVLMREGSLEAPKRQPIDWRAPDFHDTEAVESELERVFDICHGCRRCVNLCAAFPTLFDLIDESDTFEVDGVDKADYGKVVDQCFLCDLCAETKCPYLPPHEWAVDFPHLMLRAKAARFKTAKPRWRDRLITSTDPVFRMLATPGVAQTANAAAKSTGLRALGERIAGVHRDAPLPTFHSGGAQRRVRALGVETATAKAGGKAGEQPPRQRDPSGRTVRESRRLRHLLRGAQRARRGSRPCARPRPQRHRR